MSFIEIVRKSIEYGSVIANTQTLAEIVPYTRTIDDQTLRAKNGMILSIIRIDGFCHQNADPGQIDQMANIRNGLIRSLNDSRFAVYSHIIRRRTSPQAEGTFDNDFCATLNRRYMEGLGQTRMYVNEMYLTVIRRPFQGKVGQATSLGQKLRRLAGADISHDDRQEREELQDHVNKIVKGLSPFGARVLKATVRNGTVYSEPLEFLAQLLNGATPIAMALPRMPLDEYLPTRRITFGRKSLELRGAVDSQTRFGSIISVKEYPPYTSAGFTDLLLRVPGEFIVTQSFSLMDRAPALEEIRKVQRLVSQSDERGTSLQDAIIFAANEISSQSSVMGHHHMTVMPLGATLKEMELCVQAVTQQMEISGLVAVREDLNMRAAFFAQLPCNFSDIARSAMISSRNFCHMASFHNFATGKATGNHWGPAIALLQTTSMTPYYFNFHRDKVGSFTVNGSTGAGKTALMSFLVAQSNRLSPRPRVAFFDKDRGAEIFIRACGGRYEILEPGVPTGFNPLQLEGTPGDRTFLYNLLRLLVRPRDARVTLSAEQDKILANAVTRIFDTPVEERYFSNIAQLLRGREEASHDDLAARFEVWTGQNGWLFNNPVDLWPAGKADSNAGIIGFDMTKILDNEDVRSAALGYIFHRIEGMLDGTPLMLFIDEGWKLLNDDTFSAFVNDKLKTIRKQHGIVGLGTQSARDFTQARNAHTILEQTPTNIFFPDDKADEESYLGRFRLSQAEYEWVLRTPKTSRQFLIKHGADSVVATLDLGAMPDMIKVLSGDVNTIQECEDLRARYGDDPAVWLPIFCGWRNEP